MSKKVFVVLGLSVCCMAGRAESLGLASPYNLVALAGDVSTKSDVEGSIAASQNITGGTTVGSQLTAFDPRSSFAMVAGGTIAGYYNVGGGGNVYEGYATTTGTNIGLANEQGYYQTYNAAHSTSLVPQTYVGTSPGVSSPINFSQLDSSMIKLSNSLKGLAANGSVTATKTNDGKSYASVTLTGNGAKGTTKAYIFNVTAAEFEATDLYIKVDPGSTVIINIDGDSTVTLAGHIWVWSSVTGKYHQEGDADASNILFNFPNATAVAIDSQLDGSILAPGAVLTGGSQMGGTFIAESIGSTGEVHYDEFTGYLPVPDSGFLTMMGASLLSIAGALRYRMRRTL